ncbi:MAG: FHA domain-containing protein [Planctomycetota bacterium]
MIASPSLRFRITEPDCPPRDVPVVEGMVLGRLPEIDCTLNDPKVSNRHAQVVRLDEGLALEDLGSTNKTRIEDGPELGAGERCPLTEGLAIWLGRTRLEVVVGAPGPAVAPAEPPGPDVTLLARQLRDDERGSMAAGGEELTLEAPPRPKRPGDPVFHGLTTIQLPSASDPNASAAGRTARPSPARARIVLRNGAETRTHELEFPDSARAEIAVGRSRGAALSLLDPSVSANHARFVSDGTQILLEDLGSTNGSAVDDTPLEPSRPVALTADQLLRFGSVEAAFLRDEGVPMERYELALDRLRARKRLSEAEHRHARIELGEGRSHPGETLMLAGKVTPAEWVEAVRGVHSGAFGGRRRRGPRILALAVIIGLLLAYVAWTIWG